MNNHDTISIVITTIAPPTESVKVLHARLSEDDGDLIIVGDHKGPSAYDLPGTVFLSLSDQLATAFTLAKRLPTGHYARKNIGYLHAIQHGANCIYETDDDNAPLEAWGLRSEALSEIHGTLPVDIHGVSACWVNAYHYFSPQPIWPRGLPLDQIRVPQPVLKPVAEIVKAPIQQGLVNNSPDVDAIWRLTQDRPFTFDDAPSVLLSPGHWCPFNTQSTWWWPDAYPLMYLPSHCSFRMCDIWKSFVAQRCLWEMGCGVVFHAPEVVQDRNAHNIMKDFEDEIPGYLQNSRFVQILSDLDLVSGVGNTSVNLLRCYEALVQAELFPPEELNLVRAWINDVEFACSH